METHVVLGWVVLGANGVAAFWALAAHHSPRLRGRALWWCVGAAEVALLAQIILGVALVSAGGREVAGIHTFYGFVTLAALGILYSYRSHLGRARQYLLYGWGGLFITGLIIRTMIIG